MGYKVAVDIYEGPMDLLLSLIQKNEVDIYDIPIHMITEQFMDYIKDMEELNLEITSEFLVMAATLLEIKSRMLLPKEKIIEDGIEVEIDPREDLVRKLIEYKLYKEAAERLKNQEAIESRVYYKPREDLSIYDDPILELGKIDLNQLVKVINNLIEKSKRKGIELALEIISREEYTLDTCISDIEDRLKTKDSLLFSDLLSKYTNRREITAYFLSVLELVRMKKIFVNQDLECSDIVIKRRKAEVNNG